MNERQQLALATSPIYLSPLTIILLARQSKNRTGMTSGKDFPFRAMEFGFLFGGSLLKHSTPANAARPSSPINKNQGHQRTGS